MNDIQEAKAVGMEHGSLGDHGIECIVQTTYCLRLEQGFNLGTTDLLGQ